MLENIEIALLVICMLFVVGVVGYAIYDEARTSPEEKAFMSQLKTAIEADGFEKVEVANPQGSRYVTFTASLGVCEFSETYAAYKVDGDSVDVYDYPFAALIHGTGKSQRTDVTVTVDNAEQLLAALPALDCYVK